MSEDSVQASAAVAVPPRRGRAGGTARQSPRDAALPHASAPLLFAFILDLLWDRGQPGLPGWRKGEKIGNVAQEGLMQKDFYPVA